MRTTNRIDPVTRFVRSLPDRDYMLPREAAAQLGITRDRLKMLGRRDPQHLGPGYYIPFGQVGLYLYDADDLAQLRAYFVEVEKTQVSNWLRGGRGRPPVWTPAEHADRHRRRDRVRHHRYQAEKYTSEGKTERAARSLRLSHELQTGLDDQRAERLAALNAAE